MPSNSTGPYPLRYTFLLRKMMASGLLRSRTTGLASNPNTSTACLKSSSGSTIRKIIRERASASPCASESWNGTGGRYGWSRNLEKDLRSILHFQFKHKKAREMDNEPRYATRRVITRRGQPGRHSPNERSVERVENGAQP